MKLRLELDLEEAGIEDYSTMDEAVRAALMLVKMVYPGTRVIAVGDGMGITLGGGVVGGWEVVGEEKPDPAEAAWRKG